MKAIILSLSKYKEKDLMVTALTEEGAVSFKVNGGQSSTSKNAIINNPLAVVDLTLSETKNGHTNLKECSLITMPLNSTTDLAYMSAISTIQEATVKLFEEDELNKEVYEEILKAIEALKALKNPLLVITRYLLICMKLTGFQFEINHCVRCGSKKDIVAFLFNEGGFICRNCIEEDEPRDLSTSQMVLLRNICGDANYSFDNYSVDSNDIPAILDKLLLFIDDNCGHSIESPRLILNK